MESNLSDAPSRWKHGDAYDRFIGRWSRRAASRFLPWLALPPGLDWLDVGCGTGALSAGILDECLPASVVGVEPSAGFLKTAHDRLGDRISLHRGSADATGLPDDCVDVVVSGLVLNFLPDLPAALAEMTRVTRTSGTVAAYVWDYGGTMDLLRVFWDAAVDLDPDAAEFDERTRFSSIGPDQLLAHFRSAGLADPQRAALEIPMGFPSFDAYWQPFLGGQGPAPAYVSSLSPPVQARLCDAVKSRLPLEPDGSIALAARAWAVRGTVEARHVREELRA